MLRSLDGASAASEAAYVRRMCATAATSTSLALVLARRPVFRLVGLSPKCAAVRGDSSSRDRFAAPPIAAVISVGLRRQRLAANCGIFDGCRGAAKERRVRRSLVVLVAGLVAWLTSDCVWP